MAVDVYRCLLNTLLNEDASLSGKVVNDRGSPNRWGIREEDNKDLAPVSALSLEEALQRYLCYVPAGLNQLRFQTIGNAVYDLEFNHGRTQGVRVLQKALGVEVDGLIGEQTLHAQA